MVPSLSFASFGNPNRHQQFLFLFDCWNPKIIMCSFVSQYLLLAAIVSCYIRMFIACWLRSSAYGCARLALPSQWLVKSFVTDGAKIVFCNFGKSESTPKFDVFYLCESQDHSLLFSLRIFIAYCYCVVLYISV